MGRLVDSRAFNFAFTGDLRLGRDRSSRERRFRRQRLFDAVGNLHPAAFGAGDTALDQQQPRPSPEDSVPSGCDSFHGRTQHGHGLVHVGFRVEARHGKTNAGITEMQQYIAERLRSAHGQSSIVAQKPAGLRSV